MTAVTQYHLSKEAFMLACTICEQGDPSITHEFIDIHKSNIEKLIKLKAFIIGTNHWIEDENGNYVDVVYQNDEVGYIGKNKKFIKISFDRVRSYKLNLNWLANLITKKVGTASCEAENVIDNFLWQVGAIKETQIFFARRIYRDDILRQINDILQKRKGKNKIIIITSSSAIPGYLENNDNYKIILLNNCLVFDNKNFHVNLDIIKSNIHSDIKQNGFSSGYRTAYFNDIEYKFSKKQAAIIEALDKHGGKVNKYELLAEADSEQYDAYRIFKGSKGKYHPAWNVLIKNDGKGNYWLDKDLN